MFYKKLGCVIATERNEKLYDEDPRDIQLEFEMGSGRCYGIVAGMDFLMVCTYGENGADPELVLYKRR